MTIVLRCVRSEAEDELEPVSNVRITQWIQYFINVQDGIKEGVIFVANTDPFCTSSFRPRMEM